MDVCDLNLRQTLFFLSATDHTKYIGKASSHSVSTEILRTDLQPTWALFFSWQENVQLSEDGETEIEKEDKSIN